MNDESLSDEFAGSIYRHLTDASRAVDHATALGDDLDGEPTDTAGALEQINVAMRELEAARAKLEGGS